MSDDAPAPTAPPVFPDLEYDVRPGVLAHYGDLLAGHGFTEVYAMNHGGGEYQAVIFASPQCQVKFLCEQGAFVVLLGRGDAPRAYGDQVDGDTVWFNVHGVMAYEDEIHPERACRPTLAAERDEPALAAYVRTSAAALRPYLPRFIAAFSTPPPAGWWDGFRAYRARPA